MELVLLVLLLGQVVRRATSDCQSPVVQTVEGPVRGTVACSADNRLFYSFKGMPYASPPLRLQPADRHPRWQEVRDATRHGSVCLQFDPVLGNGGENGSEDCLFVNVYTPQLPAARGHATRAVLVWIHGGGFFLGSGDADLYGPEYFMDADVVLVTFNYRLGPLGFFTTEDCEAPGNYGLRDQVLLLQWVKDNIARFGGNPDLVTIFGESAGGASVSLLMLSPLAKNLFQRAISQSGSALANFAVVDEGGGMAERYATFLNCSTASSVDMASCFRRAPIGDVTAAMDHMNSDEIHFHVRVDCDSEEAFLPADPMILLKSGNFNLVPRMQGLMAEEGAFFLPYLVANSELKQPMDSGEVETWAKIMDFIPKGNSQRLDKGSNYRRVTEQVLRFYTGNSSALLSNILPLAQMYGDRNIGVSVLEEMRQAARHAPVYGYMFDHAGSGRRSLLQTLLAAQPESPLTEMAARVLPLGATHGDATLYLFHPTATGQPVFSSATQEGSMIRAVVEIWAHFARTGYPASSRLSMPPWPIYTDADRKYMRLNDAPSVGHRLFDKRSSFWHTLPINEPWKHPLRRQCTPQHISNCN